MANYGRAADVTCTWIMQPFSRVAMMVSDTTYTPSWQALHSSCLPASFTGEDEWCPYCGVRVACGVGIDESHHGLLLGIGPDNAFVCRC